MFHLITLYAIAALNRCRQGSDTTANNNMLVYFYTLSDLYLLILKSIQRIQLCDSDMKRWWFSWEVAHERGGLEKQVASLFRFSLCKRKAHWDFQINIWIWKSWFLLTTTSPSFSVSQIVTLVYFNHCYSLVHPYFQQLLLLLADSSFHVLVKHSNQLWQESILFCILVLSF